MKRFLYLILAFMLTAPLFTFVVSARDEALPKDYSSFRVDPSSVDSKGISPMSGAFISPWLYNGFTDTEWEQEISEWKLLGIEYIVMADVATVNIDDDYSIQAAFPTKLEGATQTSDSVTKIFEKCSANDIKVIIGTGNTSGGWGYIDVTSPANVETFKKVYVAICQPFRRKLGQQELRQSFDVLEGILRNRTFPRRRRAYSAGQLRRGRVRYGSS